MPARIIDGTTLAASIRQSLTPEVAAFTRSAGRPPGLGIVLVGDNPASQIYVDGKQKAGTEAGLWVDVHRLPAATGLSDVLALVQRLNESDRHDGVLVQDPLPEAMGPDASRRVFDAINPRKDVDGFNPASVGRLVQNRPTLAPCTPSGIVALLDHAQVDIGGAQAVIIGRSDIVGKPLALLLLHRHATVTICHSRTRDLRAVAATADILVAAIGRPGFVTPDFVRPGATVVDVGINRLTSRLEAERLFGPASPRLAAFDRRGSLVVGDVHPAVADVAGAMTPVPGGVGPMTIAMLLKNTLMAARGQGT